MPKGVHNSRRSTALTPEQHRMRNTKVRQNTDIVPPFYEKGIPEPPPELIGEALDEWERIAPVIFAQGMLTECDKAVMAVYCNAYASWRSALRSLNQMRERDKSGMEGNLIRGQNGLTSNPINRVVRECENRLLAAAQELGMTPVSRQRLKQQQLEQPKNPFDVNAR